ncbi:NAD-dependent epimerase/dehydratase family protein [Pseudomonas matsuisoli]|uniref:NAD(P)-dependent oxidoreductase n=1 Tax=Pseudomonas matsuisoli TaxID=1515666 RepID=A0A917UXR3_9PSED|nr:NAD-dependent epimerase/dehydratase family protein [Pseudomonas matsuisoli]GGJ93985.1 NAD(P)-dependent oxidoreductase [Pseudomonas matsuisoli]
MSKSRTLLVAGCGDVGGKLGQILAADDWSVFGLRRNVGALPPELLPVVGDLSESRCPEGWPAVSPDYVVFAASADDHDEAGYRAAYVDGVRHLLAWMAERGHRPRRLFFVSSTGVYNQADGEWIDEASPAEPARYSGRLLKEAETLMLQSGIPATVVRLAGIYGPGREWMLRQARQGIRGEDTPPRYANRIHRDDAAGLLAFLIQRDASGQPIDDCYLGVDDDPAPLHEVLDWLRARLQVTETSDEPLKRRSGSKRCSNAKARALGWSPSYPSYRDGYAEMIAKG